MLFIHRSQVASQRSNGTSSLHAAGDFRQKKEKSNLLQLTCIRRQLNVDKKASAYDRQACRGDIIINGSFCVAKRSQQRQFSLFLSSLGVDRQRLTKSAAQMRLIGRPDNLGDITTIVECQRLAAITGPRGELVNMLRSLGS